MQYKIMRDANGEAVGIAVTDDNGTAQGTVAPLPWASGYLQAEEWFEEQGRDLSAELEEIIPPAKSDEELWNEITATRAQLLDEANILVDRAIDLVYLGRISAAQRNACSAYREALRDVITQPDPRNITWPEKPTI